MKQSRIILSIIIVGGVSAWWYALVSTLNPCAWDRSYECLFGEDANNTISLSWQQMPGIWSITTTQNIQTNTDTDDQKTLAPTIADQVEEDQEAAAKKAKEEADAQRAIFEKATADLAAQQSIKKPVVKSSDKYEDDRSEENDD